MRTLAVIPGDTTIEFLLREPRAQSARVLLHEVTYWDGPQLLETLVLVHRSPRVSRFEVEGILRRRFPAAMLPRLHVFDGGDRW